MSKIEKVKEILNTIRIAISISFGMLALIVTGIIKRYDANKVDELFWLGIIAASIIVILIFSLIVKLSKRTNEIEEL